VIYLVDKDKPVVTPKPPSDDGYKIGDITVKPDPSNYRTVIEKKKVDSRDQR
jgi:hypothetical protein